MTVTPSTSEITIDSGTGTITGSINTPAPQLQSLIHMVPPPLLPSFTFTINTTPTIESIVTDSVYPHGTPFSILVTSDDADDGDTLTHTMTVTPSTSEITIDSGTGTITGSIDTPADTYTATVTVTDTHDASAVTLPFTFTVNTTPIIIDIGDRLAITGEMSSIPVTIIGGDDPNDTVEYTMDITPDTDQITIDSGNGTITVSASTPSNIYTITVTVTDSFDVGDSDTFTLTISEQIVNVAPTIRSIGVNDMYQPGDPFTISVDAFDSNVGDTLTYTIDTDLTTDQITINSDTGIITGSVDVVGIYTITVIVTDDSDESASAPFTLLINTMPVIDAIESNNVYPHGTAFSIQITSSDNDDGDTLFHTMTVTPSTSEITIDSGTGTITGSIDTPADTYTATVTVADTHGATATSNEFSFIVNTAPTISTITTDPVYPHGTPFSIQVTSSDDDDNGDTLTYTMTVTPSTSEITIGSTTGQIIGSAIIPAGTYTVAITVTDSFNAVATTTFSIAVSSSTPIQNTPPVISDVNVNDVYPLGDSFTISLDASDVDPNDSLTYTIHITPDTDQITIDSATGQIIGSAIIPAGTYTVAITVTDSFNAVATTTFSIVVSSSTPIQNTPPVISDVNVNDVYPLGDSFTISLDASDVDPNDSLTYTIHITPDTDQITIDSATGQIIGSAIIPAGTYTVAITVTDSFNAVATTTFSIVVSSSTTIQNTPPVISDVNVNDVYLLGDPFTISLDASDVDPNDSLTYAIDITPATDQITIDSATGQIIGSAIIPAGTYTVAITVTDSFNAVATTTFSIVVSSSTPIQNTPPVISDVNVNDVYPLGDSFTISLDASDVDPNDSLTYTIHITPDTDQITIDSATGQIIGSAIIPAGTYTVAVTVTDDSGASVSATLDVSVRQQVSSPVVCR